MDGLYQIFQVFFKLLKKKFWQELNKINSEFIMMKIPEIVLEDEKVIFSEESKVAWKAEKKKLRKKDLILQDERVYMIILYTFIKTDIISNNHYQEFLQLSKNSVLLDLRKVKEICERYKIDLIYSRNSGYELKGEEYDIRSLVSYSIGKILSLTIGEWLINYIFESWEYTSNKEIINKVIIKLSKEYNVTFTYDRIKEVIYFFDFLQKRKNSFKLNFDDKDIKYLEQHPLYKMSHFIVKDIFYKNCEKEKIYITIRLLSALQGNEKVYEEEFFKEVTKNIIARVQAITGIVFENPKELFDNLFEHLVPAYFRIKFDIVSKNPYTAQIMEEYNELYYLVEKGLEPLAELTGKAIPEDEVAYFTVHFGGFLSLNREEKRTYKGLSICPNGISSSLIMRTQLKELFPSIVFSSVHSLEEAKALRIEDYDMVFSTTYFQTEKQLFLTKPILNKVEQEILKTEVSQNFDIEVGIQNLDIQKLIKAIEQHATIENRKELYESISNILYETDRNYEGGKNLTELLQEDLIKFTNKKMEWQEAISIAADPLLKEGYINGNYINAMISMVKKMGAYIVLAPKVAVPHARPEEGVAKLGVSLLHLDQPVDFNMDSEYDEDKEVKLIFILAAVDSTGHLKALKQLSKILEDEENITELIDATNARELFNKINEILER
ncbi:BglG family transcription antiterminator [Carnobacterium sp. 17-4]|uniref:BglG family transcription antiterminator n=1 Tax=Carnobacterium sp. (strain 17-4) TaxID=208596 RepID=UPI0013052F3A|nr:BglG family transcription antiterminator [Carnobacterium sp. 17-4]